MAKEKQALLEMIDRPAFIAAAGIITQCNQMAKNRLIPLGKPVWDLLLDDAEAYRTFENGILYLTLQIGYTRCGATVVRQEAGDIFLLDRDADQSQLQALALAAQQLRVPFSNVMTLADCLLPELESGTHRERASQMYKALFQLMRLISNMADAERYTGLCDPHYETTELCSFFREILKKAEQTLEETDVSLSVTYPDKAVFTMIDRERMERAVYNLLSNAVKFSKPGGTVTVKLAVSGKMARLTVEDQGDGIAAHAQSTLFHRYMREPAIEDSRFGLGLGMTIIRSVASIHGGTVLLEKTGGTRVCMTIAIRKDIPWTLRSPNLRIGDYAGGLDLGLLEFSEILPAAAYEKNV